MIKKGKLKFKKSTEIKNSVFGVGLEKLDRNMYDPSRVYPELKNAGVKYARTTNSTHAFDLPTDWLELNPTCHHNDKKLSELTDLFLSKTKSQKYLPAAMFYLWGARLRVQ